MGADYRKQYRPDQLEPFFPHELFKMTVVVLCLLATIMFLAVLPVLLDVVGLHGFVHLEEPADPHGPTPVGIKPEWYFLATYQYLRLMPTELLGISGKTLGVLSQGPMMLLLLLLPFWYRRRATVRPGPVFRIGVTAVILVMGVLTIWGGWPEHMVDGHEHLASPAEYFAEHAMFFVLMGVAAVVFYILIAQERRAIRRIMDQPPPPDAAAQEEHQ